MTISSSTSKNQYTANGSNTVFAYTFKIYDDDDIKVLVDNVAQTKTTHYTVSGVGVSTGGNITFVTAPADNTVVTIKRNEPLTQEIDYVEGDDFPAAAHEEGLDRSVIRDQFLQEQINRSVRVSESSSLSITLPAPEAGKALAWNDDEDGLENLTLADTNLVEVTESITSDLTINIPADYATIYAAMAYLNGFFIAPDVSVQINVATGSYTHTSPIMGHPQGNQITITGNTATYPSGSDFVITGNSSGARATDNAAHLIMLKAKYLSEVYCNNCSAIDVRTGYKAPNIENILFWTDNSASHVGCYVYSGLTYFTKVSFHGWGSTGVAVTNSGNIRTSYCSVTGCGGYGIQSSDGSSFKSIEGTITCSNALNGVLVKRGGSAETYGLVSKGNGADGCRVEDGGSILEAQYSVLTGNGGSGARTSLGGDLDVAHSTISGNATFGIYADDGYILASGATVSSNTNTGVVAVGAGMISADGITVSTNGDGGVKASGTASISIPNSTVTGNTGVGIWAELGGRIYANNTDVTTSTSDNILSHGLGSVVQLRSGSSTNSGRDGAFCQRGGDIDVQSSSLTGNGRNGCFVDDGGNIQATSATITGNSSRGVYVANGGSINAENATINTNTSEEARVDNAGNIRVTGTGLVSGDTNLTINTPAGTASQALIWS